MRISVRSWNRDTRLTSVSGSFIFWNVRSPALTCDISMVMGRSERRVWYSTSDASGAFAFTVERSLTR